ncbi:hypothetical protein WA538_000889, partial [Blastocystis sp. DL]
MNFAISQEDIEALRAYVTAKDGNEYDDLEPGVVCFDITHNYLKVRMHDVRMPLSATVLDLKKKVELHSGTPVAFQKLCLRTREGTTICQLNDDSVTLEKAGFRNGMEVHCVDTNPDSLAKDGGLDDETKIEKHVMTDEEYNKRANTVRAYKLQMEAQRIAEGKTADSEYTEETVHAIEVGNRCEVHPGGRRGVVAWKGVLEEGDPNKGGYWVGVKLDEPTGRNDGSYKGRQFFSCPMNYGVFVRGPNVVVGDFPEEEIDLDEE